MFKGPVGCGLWAVIFWLGLSYLRHPFFALLFLVSSRDGSRSRSFLFRFYAFRFRFRIPCPWFVVLFRALGTLSVWALCFMSMLGCWWFTLFPIPIIARCRCQCWLVRWGLGGITTWLSRIFDLELSSFFLFIEIFLRGRMMGEVVMLL